MQLLRNGSKDVAGEWAVQLRVWQPSHLYYKLVEWDPATRSVVAWEKGADRQAILSDGELPLIEPADTRMRL